MATAVRNFHDVNRNTSGYLFKEEASNVREREEMKKERERLAYEASRQKSAAETAEEERRKVLDKLNKEILETRAAVAARTNELESTRTQLTSLKTDLSARMIELQSTRTQLTSMKTDLSDVRSELWSAQNKISQAKGELSTTHGDLEEEKAMRRRLPYGICNQPVVIYNPRTCCALDMGKDSGTRCWGYDINIDNGNQHLKVVAGTDYGTYFIHNVHNNKYLENTTVGVSITALSEKIYWKLWTFIAQENGTIWIKSHGEDSIIRLTKEGKHGLDNDMELVKSAAADSLCEWAILRIQP